MAPATRFQIVDAAALLGLPQEAWPTLHRDAFLTVFAAIAYALPVAWTMGTSWLLQTQLVEVDPEHRADFAQSHARVMRAIAAARHAGDDAGGQSRGRVVAHG